MSKFSAKQALLPVAAFIIAEETFSSGERESITPGEKFRELPQLAAAARRHHVCVVCRPRRALTA
jgi:hypothetical protein